MKANTQVFFDNLTAATTGLRRVGGVHQGYVTTSLYRFVGQQLLKHTERSVVSRQRQVMIAQHKAEVEVFENNQAVVMHQPVGNLVPEVAANAGNVFMQFGDQQTLIFAPIAAFDGTTEFALSAAQVGQVVAQPARIVDERADLRRAQRKLSRAVKGSNRRKD